MTAEPELRAYLNHAGTSWPKPPAVREAVHRALAAEPGRWPALLESAREVVAAFLGMPDPGRLVFTPGCTSAIATAVAHLPWSAGDVVLTSGLEHHALVRPLALLERTAGVEHRVLPGGDAGAVDLDRAAAELAGGSVRLVACTMASNVTGEILPARELAALARSHGALFLLDAAQGVGVLPVDAAGLELDLLAFAGHKGPQGPSGIGGLWARDGVRFDACSARCALTADGSRDAGGGGLPTYCDVGSVNVASASGLAAGLEGIAERGVDTVRRHVRRLTRFLQEGLSGTPGLRLVGPEDTDRRTGIASYVLERLSPAEAEEALAGRGVVARGGEHCAPLAHATLGTGEHGTLRVSFGPGSTERDAERAVDALRGVAGS